ncbi:sulfatase [Rufibacter quisquiliarum]|uniref:Arylsulfatase A-like enzyme n=1 Tax=Rufibacter quisquiliarum TaxID=1549639 RepID=A0A839GJ50_9BACT|nr:sulfatase [Rufibacter quisquiliarum]MBA9078650.1 arylsulfatase A-like enzyme [Rufibacter quisquiliarum]
MKYKNYTLALLACLMLSLGVQAQNKATKPNIVLIFIDDMGWKDAGFTGSDFYQTPHLNALAKQGMVFTNAYAAAGNCAPSRACLISGNYTPRHGIYAVYNSKRGPVEKMRLEPIPNTNALAPNMYTLAEGLRDAGYKTAMFGKWHLGGKEGTLPKDQGFDVDGSFEPPSQEEFEQNNDPKGIYKITNGAIQFMEENKNRPFFIYVSHHATHMAIQARDEMYAKMKGKKGTYQSHEKYGAMNAQMDDGVGLLLKKMKDLGLEENTLVIFTSDNGALPQSPADPLRGFKGMYYEGGIRVPFIARWPGVIKAGTQNETPIINVDLFPTFLDAAGFTKPKAKTLDGESLVKLFKGGNALQRSSIFWHFPGYLDKPDPGSRDNDFRARPVTTIRKGDWKLHLFHEEWVLDGGQSKIASNNSVELYNLRQDIGEKNNLASKQPAKRDELVADLLKWVKATDAKIPQEKNPLFGQAPAPGGKKKKQKEDED